MLCDNGPILANDNPFGVSMDLDRPPDGRRDHRVFVPQGIDPPDQFLIFVTIEPYRAGLRYCGGHAVETIEGACVSYQMRPFGFEHLPDCLVGLLWMLMRFGVGDALIKQPDV